MGREKESELVSGLHDETFSSISRDVIRVVSEGVDGGERQIDFIHLTRLDRLDALRLLEQLETVSDRTVSYFEVNGHPDVHEKLISEYERLNSLMTGIGYSSSPVILVYDPNGVVDRSSLTNCWSADVEATSYYLDSARKKF